MRWVICALLVLVFPTSGLAADLELLRGSQPVGPPLFNNWSGLYVGGQVGYGASNGDFSNATHSIIAEALRLTTLEDQFSPSTWPVLGNAANRAMMYGGFIGYNSQWQDMIVGFEANFNHTQFALVAPASPIGRITPPDSNGIPWTVAFTGSGSVTDLNYATLRGRAGLILGNFLPYAFVGAAFGTANISVSAVGSAEGNAPASGPCLSTNSPPCYLVNFNKTNQQTSIVYGAAVGGGLDIAVTHNVFLRAELEYIRFAPVADIVLAVAAARVGAGVRF